MKTLEDRLQRVEERLEELERKMETQGVVRPREGHRDLEIKKYTSPLRLWLASHWISCLGILLVILAAGWFVGVAFSNDWIEPMARVALCLLLGVGLYGWGLKVLKSWPRRGQIVLVLAQVLILIAFFAGYRLYGLFSAEVAFTWMFISLVASTFLAINRRLVGLGFISMSLALMIPYLIYESSLNSLFLLSYTLMIDLAVLFMWIRCGWRAVFYVAWVFTLIAWLLFACMNQSLIHYGLIASFYLIFLTPAARAATSKPSSLSPWGIGFLLISSTLALSAQINGLNSLSWQLVSYFWAASLAFYYSYRLATRSHPSREENRLRSYIVPFSFGFKVMVLVLMAIWSIDEVVKPPIATMTSLAQLVLAVAIARFFLRSPVAACALMIYSLVPLRLLGLEGLPILEAPFNSFRFANHLMAAFSFASATWLAYGAQAQPISSTFCRRVLGLMAVLASAFCMSLLWNVCYNLVDNKSVARSLAWILYALIAEMMIYLGNQKQLPSVRAGGIAIILFVLMGLFFNEVWQMPIVVRTITFLITGCLLMATAWLDKKSSPSAT